MKAKLVLSVLFFLALSTMSCLWDDRVAELLIGHEGMADSCSGLLQILVDERLSSTDQSKRKRYLCSLSEMPSTQAQFEQNLQCGLIDETPNTCSPSQWEHCRRLWPAFQYEQCPVDYRCQQEKSRCVPLCGIGRDDCGGDNCIDLQNDPKNCGQCGKTCTKNFICQNGSCRCSKGYRQCGERCIDPSSDPQHCGDCNQICPASYTCQKGQCTCPQGLQDCRGSCVDTNIDPNHCGGCGKRCPNLPACVQGHCQSNCPDGYTLCDEQCVDTSQDSKHCGQCGNVCQEYLNYEAARCLNGLCQYQKCRPNYADCDGNVNNGCELSLEYPPKENSPTSLDHSTYFDYVCNTDFTCNFSSDSRYHTDNQNNLRSCKTICERLFNFQKIQHETIKRNTEPNPLEFQHPYCIYFAPYYQIVYLRVDNSGTASCMVKVIDPEYYKTLGKYWIPWNFFPGTPLDRCVCSAGKDNPDHDWRNGCEVPPANSLP